MESPSPNLSKKVLLVQGFCAKKRKTLKPEQRNRLIAQTFQAFCAASYSLYTINIHSNAWHNRELSNNAATFY